MANKKALIAIASGVGAVGLAAYLIKNASAATPAPPKPLAPKPGPGQRVTVSVSVDPFMSVNLVINGINTMAPINMLVDAGQVSIQVLDLVTADNAWKYIGWRDSSGNSGSDSMIIKTLNSDYSVQLRYAPNTVPSPSSTQAVEISGTTVTDLTGTRTTNFFVGATILVATTVRNISTLDGLAFVLMAELIDNNGVVLDSPQIASGSLNANFFNNVQSVTFALIPGRANNPTTQGAVIRLSVWSKLPGQGGTQIAKPVGVAINVAPQGTPPAPQPINPAPGPAPSGQTTGAIEVSVQANVTAQPLTNAVVMIGGRIAVSVVTPEFPAGNLYRLSGLSPGNYGVSVSAPGYIAYTFPPIAVVAGLVNSIGIALNPA